ncbi:hypothetical protein Tco_0892358 [Tanacetum coccineum]|uniref:Uncharacterized protein n=1 Tax=Tanacetum coccineum TaxID=301880 RepID=A0ABQ5C5Z4_9ASTR
MGDIYGIEEQDPTMDGPYHRINSNGLLPHEQKACPAYTTYNCRVSNFEMMSSIDVRSYCLGSGLMRRGPIHGRLCMLRSEFMRVHLIMHSVTRSMVARAFRSGSTGQHAPRLNLATRLIKNEKESKCAWYSSQRPGGRGVITCLGGHIRHNNKSLAQGTLPFFLVYGRMPFFIQPKLECPTHSFRGGEIRVSSTDASHAETQESWDKVGRTLGLRKTWKGATSCVEMDGVS